MTVTLDHRIWAIAWPAIVANISIPLLGVVDASLLGHLDSPRHLGAVALGSAVLSFLYWGFGFLRMGTTGDVARANGKGDQQLALLTLLRASLLALLIAALLLLLRTPLLATGLAIMDPDPALEALALRYGELRLLSAPAVLATYTIIGWCIGRQDTRWPMLIVIATNLANIALDWLLIVVVGWASVGAAIATVAAEYLGLALALLAVYQRLPRPWPRVTVAMILAPTAYGRLLRSNTNLFLRTLMLLFAFAFFTAAGEELGENVLAANAVMIQFLLLAAFALDGFAYAAEGVAGEALGAGDLPRFHHVARRCGRWCAISALVISGVIGLARPWLLPLLTDIDEVQSLMQAHSLWLVALPLLAAPSYLLDGLFIAAGATRAMAVSMLLSNAAVYLPCWYLTQPLGNQGLWLSFALFNAARGATLAWYYRRFTSRDRWLTAARRA